MATLAKDEEERTLGAMCLKGRLPALSSRLSRCFAIINGMQLVSVCAGLAVTAQSMRMIVSQTGPTSPSTLLLEKAIANQSFEFQLDTPAHSRARTYTTWLVLRLPRYISFYTARVVLEQLGSPGCLASMVGLMNYARGDSQKTDFACHHCDENKIVSTGNGPGEARRHYQTYHQGTLDDGHENGFTCAVCPSIFFCKQEALRTNERCGQLDSDQRDTLDGSKMGGRISTRGAMERSRRWNETAIREIYM
jgi:hypothetical protein